MPAKNLYHDAVVDALKADGWTITDDPLAITVGKRDLLIDLGAERPLIGAEKGTERIAVEVQSFLSPSPVADFQQALGRYAMYRVILSEQQPDRPLFLAVSDSVYDGVLSEPLGQKILTSLNVRVMVFNPSRREVVQWIS